MRRHLNWSVLASIMVCGLMACARPERRASNAERAWVEVNLDTVVGTFANNIVHFGQTLTYTNRGDSTRVLRRCTFTLERAQEGRWDEVFNNACIGKDVVDTIRPTESVVFPLTVRGFVDCPSCEPTWKSHVAGAQRLRIRLDVRQLTSQASATGPADSLSRRTSDSFVLVF